MTARAKYGSMDVVTAWVHPLSMKDPHDLTATDILYQGAHRHPSVAYREVKLLVIGVDPMPYATRFFEYLVEVPPWVAGWSPDSGLLSSISISPKLSIEECMRKRVAFLVEQAITGPQKPLAPNGMKCVLCGDFNPYAASNMDDGTFRCFSCRQDPYRASALVIHES